MSRFVIALIRFNTCREAWKRITFEQTDDGKQEVPCNRASRVLKSRTLPVSELQDWVLHEIKRKRTTSGDQCQSCLAVLKNSVHVSPGWNEGHGIPNKYPEKPPEEAKGW